MIGREGLSDRGLAVDYLHESAATIYRRRRRQRTIITMTFVTLLLCGTAVYAASYVQGWAGASVPKAVINASCTSSSQPLAPRGVTVNVYNSTDRTGLAAKAGNALRRQGFQVATVDNDPLAKSILSIGEIRHGPSGLEGAILAAKRLPGARIVQDDRMDASVDIILGNTFKTVTVPPKVAVSKKATPTPHC